MNKYTQGWERIFSKTITLTKEEFDKLPEYSLSIPTGTTIGKQWKHQIWDWEFPTGGGRGHGQRIWSDKWKLCEYTNHRDPKLVGIRYKDIVKGWEE